MKKVLITGANSYIGMSFENWITSHCDDITVETQDMIGDAWKKVDFGQYDTIFHVAGIAHQKETKEKAELYYKVNRDLAIATAKKAKKSGVKQFVILSSMSVYGMKSGMITKETKENPTTHYGKSKYEADEEIKKFQDDNFTVSILRPPMVYGNGCKGNYQLLRKLALKTPVFPKFSNERSMIYISNLVAFVEKIIREKKAGIFFPQNAEYVETTNMVMKIANSHRKKIIMFSLLNWMIYIMMRMHIGVVEKVFGTLIYEKIDLCDYVDFNNSIIETEKINEKER